MSQTNQATTGSESASTPADAGGGAGGEGAGGGTQGQAGAVPQAELDRLEAERRQLQSERDRLRVELEAARKATAATTTPPADDGGFDPTAFRRELMRDVLGATALQQAAVSLKTEFPEADSSLFEADRLAEFSSPESLRLAAEASHRRVATRVEAAVAKREEELRTEFEAKHGSGSGSPQGAVQGVPGDPTPAQLQAMSASEWDELEAKNPGVIDRVLRSNE